LTVNVPVRRQGRPLAVFSVTADAGAIDALVSDTRRTLIAVIGLVFGAILAGVITVVVVLGWRVSQQARELSERADELVASYRELEQSSIEAIETLNATVEAKDPYTAGHSQRVRRIALAIGRELQLPPKRLGILAQAALFHDVGKIGVPDAILTKPSRLTPSEYDVMKRHAADGADIIARLSRLKDAVPAVRHHHEHWDGCGYPDGLRAEEIPLEASIIGLADAWDAMTTTRPYAAARSQEDAMAQLEIGSGVQFNPAVVHAFFEVAQRRPQEIKPPGEKPLLAAAI
jgi:putative nucleotidyltransferase with HDIG domain